MGKGSKPRPFAVARDSFEERWAQTFGARRELTELMREGECAHQWMYRDDTFREIACGICGIPRYPDTPDKAEAA